MKRTLVVLAATLALSGRGMAQDVGPIVAEAVVDAPVAAVWSAWTTGAGLRSWLAPHAEIDLRVGGLMRTNYDPKETLGDPHTIENTILSYEPGRMVSIKVTRFPEGFPFPHAVGDMWTVIYFEAAGSDRTKIRVVGLGFRGDDESQRMRAFFERGNQETLAHLRAHFAGGTR